MEENKSLTYRRSTSAPNFVTDRSYTSKLQSFIEYNISQNESSFMESFLEQRNYTIKIPKSELHKYFSVNSPSYMRDILLACKALKQKEILTVGEKTFDMITVFSRCTLDENGDLYVEISPAGVNAYNNSNPNQYAMVNPTLIRDFRCRYTSYFYDYALRNLFNKKYSFELTLEELKIQFLSHTIKKDGDNEEIAVPSCKDSQIKTRWILPAISELQEKFDEGSLDFYLEIDEHRTRYEETVKKRGRPKIAAYRFIINQKSPNVEKEKAILIQQITTFLSNEIKDDYKVYEKIQPWKNQEVPLSSIKDLKKRLDCFPSLNKNRKLRNPIGWLLWVADINNRHKNDKDFIEYESNEAIDKWKKIVNLFKADFKSSVSNIIENFVVDYYSKSDNLLIITMITPNAASKQFILDEYARNLIEKLVINEFGKSIILKLEYTIDNKRQSIELINPDSMPLFRQQ